MNTRENQQNTTGPENPAPAPAVTGSGSMTGSSSSAVPSGGEMPKWRVAVLRGLHWMVLVLSVALVGIISYDTFKGIRYLESGLYMRFQLFVCLAFMADFFIELWLWPKGRRRRYVSTHLLFLLISIPYLSIIRLTGVTVDSSVLSVLRFLPVARGALAMVIVFNYLTTSRIAGMFLSYMAIMVMTIYFASLIFFEREQPVNPMVTSFWDALWFCCTETTSLGSNINPVTNCGRIVSVVVAVMGMTVFPLFTVYLTSVIVSSSKKLNILKIVNSNVKNAPEATDTGDSGNPTVAH